MASEGYINLFASCIISIGYSRSAIFDLQRNDYWFISNDWGIFLDRQRYFKKSDAIKRLPDLSAEEVNEFISFLLDEEIAFLSEEDVSDKFPPLSTEFKVPNPVETLSYEIEIDHPYFPIDIINDMLVNYVVIHTETPFDILSHLRQYENTRIKGIQVVMDYDFAKTLQLKPLIDEVLRIHCIVIRNARKTKQETYKGTLIQYIGDEEPELNHCFRINQRLYLESLHYHTYYHRRVHLTKDKDIKNAYDTEKQFGNLASESLDKVIKTKDFQQLGMVKKSHTDICRDCEFAPVCVDKRTIKRRGDGIWFSPQECTYNPYICKETGEKGYYNLEDCGIYSTNSGFRIEVDLFIEMKARAWGE